MLLKQTKIVATISDQRCDVDFIKQLFDAGMNVVRMNTAHLGREGAEKLINNVRSVRYPDGYERTGGPHDGSG